MNEQAMARRRRRRRYLAARTTSAEPHLDVLCPTPWKVRYRGRKEARAALRRQRPLLHVSETGRLPRPYRCVCGCFHAGHLPSVIVAGRIDRTERYGAVA